jgi:AAA domain
VNAAELARSLKAKRAGSGWLTRCPAHDDRHPSLSISEGEDGRLLLHCHAGCEFDAILQAAGIERARPNGEDRAKRKIVATYIYRDEEGQPLFQVRRWDPKDFTQARYDAGNWISGPGCMRGVRIVAYRLNEWLAESGTVYVVEGEKDCDRLWSLGLPATCNPTGAGKWRAEFNAHFADRDVVIIPDMDDTGIAHARSVGASLRGDNIEHVRIAELSGAKDISEWLDQGHSIYELHPIPFSEWINPRQTKPLSYTLLRDLKPHLRSNEIVKDLIPRRGFGEVHADSGAGKTAIIVDLLLHVAAGISYRNRRTERQPVAYIALEGHGGIDNRVIAAAAEIGITDAPFALVKSSDSFRDPEAAERAGKIAAELAQNFGGDNPIIAIDTYTAALGAGGSDCDPVAVSEFIANVQKHLLTGCTTLILHHFGKDSSRGGRGWSGLRASLDFELEIDRDDDLRTMRVTKSRDGSDQQPALCYRFHSRVLGQNNYGEDVTAVTVEHLADEIDTRRGKRHSPKARAALNVLWECIKDPARSFPMTDEPRLRCTTLANWEQSCTAPGAISNSKEERDRRKQFKAAKAELEDAAAIICDGYEGTRVRPAPSPAGAAGKLRCLEYQDVSGPGIPGKLAGAREWEGRETNL